MRTLLAFVLAAALLRAEPKKKPEDYPVHARNDKVALGVEYMVHSFSGQNQTYISPNHLIVEVAIYPTGPLIVSNGNFKLRINSKKTLVFAQNSSLFAASLKDAEWGRMMSRSGGQFPGAPAPQIPDPSGIEKEEPIKPDQLAVQVALKEGETSKPVSGFVYFPHKGKIKSIKSLELLYESDAGSLTLPLI